MSASSTKGKTLELDVARIMRKAGFNVERDKRSGAGAFHKMDAREFDRRSGLALEVKNTATIKVKEAYRQALAGASYGQAATVVFQADEHLLACLSFTQLVDMAAELEELRALVRKLEAPVAVQDVGTAVDRAKATKIASGAGECRNGHLVAPGSSKCLTKGCQFGSSYKAKKEKRL